MNCQEIKSATDIASTNLSFQAHLADCSSCRQHVAEMNSLRALLRQQPRLEVPGDYDFHLRARIARAQSDRQTAATGAFSLAGSDFWRTVTEWVGSVPTNFALSLRGGVAATAAVAALVAGLSLYQASEETAPSVPTSDVASLSQGVVGNLSSSLARPSDSEERRATLAVVAPARTIRTSRSRAALTQPSVEIPQTSIAGQTIAFGGPATHADLSTEGAWRVYNAERREMISSAQQTTYLGAESAPRLTRTGTKEVAFVPSI